MAIQERERQLRIVAEIMLVHLPVVVKQDQALAHDLLAVVGTALRAVYDDADQSAKAWDKRAYDVKADSLRRDWDWALAASNYALGLALDARPLTPDNLAKARLLIRPELEKPTRKQIPDPARFRGAAAAVKTQQAHKRSPVRGG